MHKDVTFESERDTNMNYLGPVATVVAELIPSSEDLSAIIEEVLETGSSHAFHGAMDQTVGLSARPGYLDFYVRFAVEDFIVRVNESYSGPWIVQEMIINGPYKDVEALRLIADLEGTLSLHDLGALPDAFALLGDISIRHAILSTDGKESCIHVIPQSRIMAPAPLMY